MRAAPPATRIFLIGFMGTGKSTLGTLLADRLGWDFLDVDSLIEEAEGASIVRIFAEKGEPHFRELERRILAGLASYPRRAVIACGGGTFCTEENRNLMLRAGITVWIDQPFDRIWERRSELSRERPLMGGEAELRALYEQRVPLYRFALLRLAVADQALPQALSELRRMLDEGFSVA